MVPFLQQRPHLQQRNDRGQRGGRPICPISGDERPVREDGDQAEAERADRDRLFSGAEAEEQRGQDGGLDGQRGQGGQAADQVEDERAGGEGDLAGEEGAVAGGHRGSAEKRQVSPAEQGT
jgi:hypothetical protein